MEDKKRILIFAGCTDKKLISKISAILDSDIVEKVYLVRRQRINFSHPKLTQYGVPCLLRKILPLREFIRISLGIYLLLFRGVNLIIGIHFIMHGIYAFLLSKIFNIKYILLFIESPEKYKWDKIMVRILKKASAIGVRGDSSKEYLLKKGISGSKIFIPPNEFVFPDIARKSRKIYDVIYIGNFVDIKDLPLWVETIKYVKKEIKGIRGVMLGDGIRFNDIKKLIFKNGLDSNIKLAGRQEDVYSYIEKAKILLMTSKSEGLPMAVIECMALGVPVIMPSIGDIGDLINNGINGITLEDRESIHYANSIIKLLKDEKSYSKMSSEAIKSISVLSLQSKHTEIVNLWNNILKRV